MFTFRTKSRAIATMKPSTLDELLTRPADIVVRPEVAAMDQHVRDLAAGLPLVRGAFRIRALLDVLQAEIYAAAPNSAEQAALCHLVSRILMATGNYRGFGYATPSGAMLEIPTEPDPDHAGGYRIVGGRPVQELPGYTEHCRHYYIASKLRNPENS